MHASLFGGLQRLKKLDKEYLKELERIEDEFKNIKGDSDKK